jgi:arylsulfatase A-like enzyme
MAGPWDAPIELRERYVAEDDPPPRDFIRPPAMLLAASADPDELLGVRQAYAAQVSVLDSCLEALLDGWRESPLMEETLFVVLSARGYPLGVHGQVGMPPDEAAGLYGELTSIPWLLRLPRGSSVADRGAALVQPPDLFATLADWFGCDPLALRRTGQLAEQGTPSSHPAIGRSLLPLVRGQATAVRDRAGVVSATSERALRTPAWYARFATGDTAELFVKPDDRWEINDVSRRCPEVTEAMRDACNQLEHSSVVVGASEAPAELDDILVQGLE